MKNLIKELKHFFYWKFKAKPSGLSETPIDERDFQTGIFNWFGYTPKHTKHEIPTLSVKHQEHNNCQWNATAVQKEPDEKEVLSVRSLCCKGFKMGRISGDGFSNLRDGQDVLSSWGILKEGVINEGRGLNWSGYININPDLHIEQAGKHKISSYWSVSSRNDAIKLLDDGKIITTGLKWYTGFNQGGGFAAPWLITKAVGYYVGGHAVSIIGYDLNYKGKQVYIIQNSYGKEWGDNGKFYVEMSYLDSNNYGYFVNMDEIDKELGQFLVTHDGKNVKGSKSNSIYHIQGGKKKPYTSWASYLAWNGKQKGFVEVPQELIDRVEKGDIMDIEKTEYWKFLKDIKKDNQLDYLLQLLNKLN